MNNVVMVARIKIRKPPDPKIKKLLDENPKGTKTFWIHQDQEDTPTKTFGSKLQNTRKHRKPFESIKRREQTRHLATPN